MKKSIRYKKNLVRAIWYILCVVRDKNFDMRKYRNDENYKNPVCNTVGCAAGHLTAIIPKNLIIYFRSENIDFQNTIQPLLGLASYEYSYLFSGRWYQVDNTRLGFAYRAFKLLAGYKVGLEDEVDTAYELTQYQPKLTQAEMVKDLADKLAAYCVRYNLKIPHIYSRKAKSHGKTKKGSD